ncbi:MAG: hypothetical protein FJ306_14135 [Planctomycetes bacterium]|nr:hypothetical protein [Planctomycetota bacterium]
MDPLQFSLFFAALLIGYLLLHVRVARFEQHLEKLVLLRSIDDRLRQLDDRVQLLGQSVERIRVERVEAQLERLHDDLQDLREVTSGIQPAVVQMPTPTLPSATGGDAPAEAPAARIVAAVENRLLQLGYRDVQILSDLQRLDAAVDAELQVECWRGGMPSKGRVLVRNGTVRDVAVQTVTQMFP